VKKSIFSVFLAVLLAISIGFNFFVWLDLRSIKQAPPTVSREQLENITQSLAEINQALSSMAKEQRWIAETAFQLDKENSTRDNMILDVKVSFNRIAEDQKPIILHRLKGETTWEEDELTQKQGLEYEAKLLVSALNEYEYQVTASGSEDSAGDVLPVPYNIYGLPKWNTDLKLTFTGNAVDISLFVLTSQNFPLPEMRPATVRLRMESLGLEPEIVDFAMEKGAPEAWSAKLYLPDVTLVSDIEAYIDVTYENGLQKTEPFALLEERVRFEMDNR
jgi:hypothetical protein